MVLEYTLDQRIEHLSPKIDDVIRRELQSVHAIVRTLKYTPGAITALTRICLIYLDIVFSAAGKTRPSPNLFDCLEFAERTPGPSGGRLLPMQVISILNTIRIYGNKSDHADSAPVSLEEAEGAMAMFLQAIDWFYTRCDFGPKLEGITSLPSDSAVDKSPSGPQTEAQPARALRQMPTPPSSFIGRAEELAKIDQFLDKTRLLTLIGSGGCGKTRLAIQAANHEKFAGNEICFIDLTAASSAEDVITLAHKALSVEVTASGESYDRVVSAIGSRDLLIVLDNCEQVVEEASRMAWILLNRNPNLRIVATSRQPLDVNGEVTYRVPSLAVPRTSSLPFERLMQFDAVQLFIARACSVEPSFAVTNETAPAIAEICSRLDGVPLAIELAAARIRAMTPREICERLSDAFKLLAGSSRSGIPRHQTLRATLEWSHQLLTADEKILFRRIAVFQGGFSLAEAETICGLEPLSSGSIVDLVEDLVDKSLVTAETTKLKTRFRMLETVREFASHQLEKEEEAESLRAIHAVTFCEEAASAALRLRSSEQASAFDALDAERWNLSSAISHAIANQNVDLAASAIIGAWRFWYTRGYYEEGILMAEQVLGLLQDNELEARSKVSRILSLLCVSAGYDEKAVHFASMNVNLRKQMGNQYDLAEALVNRAVVLIRIGMTEETMQDASEAEAILEGYPPSRALWANWNTIALILLSRDQYDEANITFEKSRAGWDSVGDIRGVARALDGRLACEIALKHSADAAECGLKLASIWENLEHAQGTTTFLARCADFATSLGNPAAAKRLLQACKDFSRRKGTPLSDEDERLIERALRGLESSTDVTGPDLPDFGEDKPNEYFTAREFLSHVLAGKEVE